MWDFGSGQRKAQRRGRRGCCLLFHSSDGCCKTL